MNKIQLIDAESLYHKPIKHPKMLVEGLFSNGLVTLSGDSKIGKSWLVLWLCLKIAKGESVWNLPTDQRNVVYLALEDKDWRIQDRLQKLTTEPPDNLFVGFSCGRIGAELEAQIEDVMKDRPDTGLIFIDTLQMIREVTGSKGNPYAQDYKEFSAIKKLADKYDICIFVIHHTKKERDPNNPFNNASGTMALTGVADTNMVLTKENRFGAEAVLDITGRDVEEKKLKLRRENVVWEITEELKADDIRKEKVPTFVFQVVDYLMENGEISGTISDIMNAVGETELQPGVASKYLIRHYNDVLLPLGISYEYKRTSSARIITLKLNDGNDANDGESRSETYASLVRENGDDDSAPSLPDLPSQPSCPSQVEFMEADDDEELPF